MKGRRARNGVLSALHSATVKNTNDKRASFLYNIETVELDIFFTIKRRREKIFKYLEGNLEYPS
jgi:hypothetical protein